MIYRCKKCNKFLGNIKSGNVMSFHAYKINFKGNTIYLKCKCGEVAKIKKS